MALSSEQIREYTLRLLKSRMRILCNHGFYGLLLMHIKFSVDETIETASTDGRSITFGTEFLLGLNDDELDFVMMHEILHVVLKHFLRGADSEDDLFNIACDIVVNSNILLENNMDLKSVTLRKYGEAMHTAPDGKEGYLYTAEQVYSMLKARNIAVYTDNKLISNNISNNDMHKETKLKQWDNHSKWGKKEDKQLLNDMWDKHIKDACESIRIKDPSNERGLLPLFAERFLEELNKPQVDWRTILNEFVQEEVVDYSFMPPDRRFHDNQFFLPDFNEKDDKVEKILFMIDKSGSMSDKAITQSYSEVKGAIDQFGGKLSGWLGFFNADVIEPKPFEGEDDFKVIKPKGGGGTSFYRVFTYIRENMQDDLPVSIIILTDGYAPFPEEKEALGIPVLWLINNDKVEVPWGKVARVYEK